MLKLMKRGKAWYARGSIKGRDVFKSLDTPFRDVAWDRMRELEKEAEAGTLGRLAWRDFDAQFRSWIAPHIRPSSIKKYSFVLARFGRFLSGQRIEGLRQVTPAIVSDYMAERHHDRHPTRGILVGPEGIKSDLRVLRRVFSYAKDCGYIAENPVRTPRLNTVGGKTQPFTRMELAAMFAEDLVRRRADLRALLFFFPLTGLRISDVAHFLKTGVNFETKHLQVPTRKRGVVVSLPLHPDLEAALLVHLAEMSPLQRESVWLFPTSAGRPRTNLDAILRRLWQRAGIANGHAHRFRDTFAVLMLETGASLYDVAKMLGCSAHVAEKHYTPYVRELQERGRRFLYQVDIAPLAALALPAPADTRPN